jgi:hypothetical protein
MKDFEKLKARMEYWRTSFDKLANPILVGIEHENGVVNGVMIKNPNNDKLVSLNGYELRAILSALNDGTFTVPLSDLEPEEKNRGSGFGVS